MPKQKIGHRIMLAVFIVVICFPWLSWFFLEKYVDLSNYENREMAQQPRLTIANYGTFSEEYSTYFNDCIPFRNNLIALNSAIDYFVFNKSNNDYVIKGEDNWLYYTRADDGDSINCYMGKNFLSQEELEGIARNCIAQRDFLAKKNVEFIVFIAPNKERIYYENMPPRYGKPAETYKALQIVEYLQSNTDIRVIYPYEELMSAKECLDYNIWYKTDTHWNLIGGYVGASALMSELGIKMPKIDSNQITISEGDNTSGDLAGMLGLTKQLLFADYEYIVKGYDTHSMQNLEWDFNNVISYHAIKADPRKIYVLRDSFASNMSEYIGSQFSDSYMRYKYSYSYDDFVSQNPDIFVYETVERYARELGDFSVQ